MRRSLASLAAALLLAAALPTGPAAAADDLPYGTVVPFVTCVHWVPGPEDPMVGGELIVAYGYESTLSVPVTIPAGTDNFLALGRRDRGQPRVFLPGRHEAVLLARYDSPVGHWVLNGTDGGALFSHPACGTVSTASLVLPETATAGAPVPVTVTVRTPVLTAPTPGTVDVAVDGVVVATAPVDASGRARLTLPAAVAGTRTVTATYSPAADAGVTGSSTTSRLEVVDTGTVSTGDVVLTPTSARVTVTRTRDAGTATVDWTTADGTARAGEDYTRASGTVTFAAGQTTATVEVPLAPRAAGAPQEQLFVLLQRASTTVGAASAVVTLPAGPGGGAGGDGGGPGQGPGAGDGGGQGDGNGPGDGSSAGAGAGTGGSGGTSDPVASAGGTAAGTPGAQGVQEAVVGLALALTGIRSGGLLGAAAGVAAAGALLVLGSRRRRAPLDGAR